MTLYQSFRRYLRNKSISVEDSSIEGTTIVFRHNNLTYVYLYDSENPYYFRLLLPRIADYENLDEARLNKKALELSGEYKIAKIVVMDNQIWVSFEQMILDPEAENTQIYNVGLGVLHACYLSVTEYANSLRHNR